MKTHDHDEAQREADAQSVRCSGDYVDAFEDTYRVLDSLLNAFYGMTESDALRDEMPVHWHQHLDYLHHLVEDADEVIAEHRGKHESLTERAST